MDVAVLIGILVCLLITYWVSKQMLGFEKKENDQNGYNQLVECININCCCNNSYLDYNEFTNNKRRQQEQKMNIWGWITLAITAFIVTYYWRILPKIKWFGGDENV